MLAGRRPELKELTQRTPRWQRNTKHFEDWVAIFLYGFFILPPSSLHPHPTHHTAEIFIQESHIPAIVFNT
jgi:hypothetical protein